MAAAGAAAGPAAGGPGPVADGAAGPGAFGTDPARRRFARFVCLLLAGAGWANIAFLGNALLARRPPAAAFDLELVLEAARRVAAGASPYDPNAVASGVSARDLFSTYPPFVAQALVPLSGLPTWVVLTGQCVGAALGLLVVAALIGRSPLGRPTAPLADLSLDTVLVAAAAAPFFFPLTVALLFGNVDAWFPLLFGLVVLAVPAASTIRTPSADRAGAMAGGVGLGLTTGVKIGPGLLFVWFAARASRRGAARRSVRQLLAVFAAGIAAGLAILAASVAVGGLAPWQDYLAYLRQAGNVDLATWVNVGPASVAALIAGNDGLAQPIGLAVGVAALAGTVGAARLVEDPLESLFLAILASLVVLPITWYHYPVVLVPVALAAWTRSRRAPFARRVSVALLAALVIADLAILIPVAVWVAALPLAAAVHYSADRSPSPSR